MSGISRIVLDNVLPEVFVGDEAASHRSDVWNTRAEFERGKCYCIKAASGTGKTSLCSFLMGVRHDYRGTISFDSTDLRRLTVALWSGLRRRSLAYLPQELELFDALSARDNVLIKNRLTDFHTEAEIRRMFEMLGIDNRYLSPAGRMSVGQRQRVAIIRAICQPFDFILLDEPVSHLDAANNALCGQLVVDSAKAQGAGIIFTSVGNPLHVDCPVVNIEL